MKSGLDLARVHEKFRPYVGDHHKCLSENYVMKGGMVRFSEHIGKPLSDKLWDDLEFRLHASNLRVYSVHDSRWLDGPIPGAVRIFLDDSYLVKEIDFAPFITPAMVKLCEKNRGKPWTIESLPDIKSIHNVEAEDKF